MRLLQVPREYRAAEAVRGVVCTPQGFSLGFEAGDDDEGAKDFFAVDFHCVGDVREDRRGDEEALAGGVFMGFTAGEKGGAFAFAGVDVGEDPLVLLFCDLGALEGGVFEGVADFADGVDGFFEFFDEFVVDGVLDEDSGGGGADLAAVGHDACVAPLDGLF